MADPNHTIAIGRGLQISTGKQTFKIIAFDSEGKRLTVGGDNFIIDIVVAETPVEAQIDDNKDGTYLVTYQPKKNEEAKISISIGETPIKGSPFTAIKHNPDVKIILKPVIKEIVLGAKYTFTLVANDLAGNPLEVDQTHIAGYIEGPDPQLSSAISQTNPGEYKLEFVPKVEGAYVLEVYILGRGILGPEGYKFQVSKGSDPSFCEIRNLTSPSLDTQNTFIIVGKRENGTNTPSGGENFSVSILGQRTNQNIDLTVKDLLNGQYAVQYTPKTLEKLVISVSLNDIPIKGSPSIVYVKPATKIVCAYGGTGVSQIVTGKEATISLVTQDQTTKTPVKIYKEAVEISIKGPNGPIDSRVEYADLENDEVSTFKFAYIPVDSGVYLIDLYLFGVSLFGANPRSISTTEPADPVKSYLEPLPFETTPWQFKFVTVDQFGNVTTLPTKIKARLEGPDALAKLVCENQGNGNYIYTIEATKYGKYNLHLLIHESDTPISSSPYSFYYGPKGGLSVEKIKIDQESIKGSIVSRLASFSMDISKLNIQNLDASSISAEIKDPNDTLIPYQTITTNPDIFTIQYMPTVAGKYIITIYFLGIKIYYTTIKVIRSVKYVQNVIRKQIVVVGYSVKYDFRIEASDSDEGIEIESSSLSARIEGPESIQGEIVSLGQGNYSLTFTPNVQGSYTIRILLNGSVLITEFKLDTATSTGAEIDHASLTNLKLNSPFALRIKATSLSTKTESTESLSATITDPQSNKISIGVVDNLDGTYTLPFTPTKPGHHSIQLLQNQTVVLDDGFDIPDSPTDAAIDSSAPQRISAKFLIGSIADETGANLTVPPYLLELRAYGPQGFVPGNISLDEKGSYWGDFHPPCIGNYIITIVSKGKILSTVTSLRVVSIDESGPTIDSIAQDPLAIGSLVPIFNESNSEESLENVMMILKDPNGVCANISGFKLNQVGLGHYKLDGELKGAGNYAIGTKVNGIEIENKDLIMEAKNLRPDLEIIETIHCKVTVFAKKSTGGDDTEIKVFGPDGKLDEIKVTDHSDGTYSVEYPGSLGQYTVSATVNGQHVVGSPFEFNVC
eukprot:TRINITY_DN7857_c0_g1_i2.p1 TRINITY_DN7857_c0_g1~~TRINITY_DN7857_c0_g1_i2.p1  ORF type:complete len:1098 (+),score=271.78 TRINITY_DN7857_c0_g1_i2:74-3295(+)